MFYNLLARFRQLSINISTRKTTTFLAITTLDWSYYFFYYLVLFVFTSLRRDDVLANSRIHANLTPEVFEECLFCPGQHNVD